MIEEYIAAAIRAIPDIDTLAPGGVYSVRIDRKKTPDAFEAQPPQLPKRSVTVIGSAESPELRGPNLSISTCTVFVRWPDTEPDKIAAHELMAAILGAINQQVIGVTGNCGMVEFADRMEQPDPFFDGGRMAYLRFRVAGLLSGVGS